MQNTHEGRDYKAVFNNSTSKQPRTTTDASILNNVLYIEILDFVRTLVNLDKFKNTTIKHINYDTFKKLKSVQGLTLAHSRGRST